MPVVIRAAFAAALALAPLAARADAYLLVCGPAACTASDGTTQPAGTALGRILWDGKAAYTPPAGQQVVKDDGRAVYQPAAVHPTSIGPLDFLNRFTAAEQSAVQQAAVSAPTTLGVGLTTGLAAKAIDLTGCPTACASATLKTWMDGLVSAGAITSARETAILTP